VSARILAKAGTAGAYTAGKAAAQSGTVGGIAVTLVASHDASRRLCVDVADAQTCSRLVSAVGALANWQVEAFVTTYPGDAAMFEADPLAFVAGWKLAGGA
jgi:hypothetical protein